MAKRKHSRRSDDFFKAFVILSFGLTILLVVLLNLLFKVPLSGALFFWAFMIMLMILAGGYIVLSLPVVKGKIGEYKVNKVLKTIQKKNGGYIINNVIIPSTDEEKTSQVDHIYLSSKGIFVIETKNYSGRIYGETNQLKWKQVLNFGHTKNDLYNPLKQNNTHVYRLKELIKEDKLTSMVVFIHADLSYLNADGVFTLKEFKNELKKYKKNIYTNEKLNEYYEVLKNFKDNPIQTNKEHVKEIKKIQEDIKNNICPRCGSELILRTSSSNKQFYGCSAFPKCKFTKKIDD